MFKSYTIENNNIKSSWKLMFKDFINLSQKNKKYEKCLHDINNILDDQLSNNNIYPESNKIFHAFEYFEVSECKVVILGQDPYHQKNQAMGLSFSVPKNIKIPPSLRNIYKEIINDNNCSRNEFEHGDLTSWASQGVLLLNTALTVEDSKPNSHSKYWQLFTDFVIEWLSNNTDKEITFMLWGGNAKKKIKYINQNNIKHIILEANHPSPLSANRGGWFGCEHFSLTNHLINW